MTAIQLPEFCPKPWLHLYLELGLKLPFPPVEALLIFYPDLSSPVGWYDCLNKKLIELGVKNEVRPGQTKARRKSLRLLDIYTVEFSFQDKVITVLGRSLTLTYR